MYKFSIKKSPESTNEEFDSAMNCTRTCIESILDNNQIQITISDNIITIHSIDPECEIELSANECKEKIKGCFCDSSSKLYPEFEKIEPLQ